MAALKDKREPNDRTMPHTKGHKATGKNARPSTKTNPSRITQKFHTTPNPGGDSSTTIRTVPGTRNTDPGQPTSTITYPTQSVSSAIGYPWSSPPYEVSSTTPDCETTSSGAVQSTYIPPTLPAPYSTPSISKPPAGYSPTSKPVRTKTWSQTVVWY